MSCVVFTGHRDKTVTEDQLTIIKRIYGESIWVSGGSRGFDKQVHEYAKRHGIEQKVILPDYERYTGAEAPLRRNDTMLRLKPLAVIACYDGRKNGGTYYTIRKALQNNLIVITINEDVISIR